MGSVWVVWSYIGRSKPKNSLAGFGLWPRGRGQPREPQARKGSLEAAPGIVSRAKPHPIASKNSARFPKVSFAKTLHDFQKYPSPWIPAATESLDNELHTYNRCGEEKVKGWGKVGRMPREILEWQRAHIVCHRHRAPAHSSTSRAPAGVCVCHSFSLVTALLE